MSSDSAGPKYDHVLRDAIIYDGGSDTRATPGEIAINGERIVHVGKPQSLPPGSGKVETSLRGRAVAPGFIDAHTHDDRLMLSSPDMAPNSPAVALARMSDMVARRSAEWPTRAATLTAGTVSRNALA